MMYIAIVNTNEKLCMQPQLLLVKTTSWHYMLEHTKLVNQHAQNGIALIAGALAW